MKHKFSLIAVSLFIALVFLSAGRAAWQDQLQIDITVAAGPPEGEVSSSAGQAATVEGLCIGSAEAASEKALPEKTEKAGAETEAAVPDAAETGEENPGAAAQDPGTAADSEPEAGVEEDTAEPGSGADSAGGGADEEEPPAGEGAGASE